MYAVLLNFKHIYLYYAPGEVTVDQRGLRYRVSGFVAVYVVFYFRLQEAKMTSAWLVGTLGRGEGRWRRHLH